MSTVGQAKVPGESHTFSSLLGALAVGIAPVSSSYVVGGPILVDRMNSRYCGGEPGPAGEFFKSLSIAPAQMLVVLVGSAMATYFLYQKFKHDDRFRQTEQTPLTRAGVLTFIGSLTTLGVREILALNLEEMTPFSADYCRFSGRLATVGITGLCLSLAVGVGTYFYSHQGDGEIMGPDTTKHVG